MKKGSVSIQRRMTELIISLCSMALVLATINITYWPAIKEKKEAIMEAREEMVIQQQLIEGNLSEEEIQMLNGEDPLDLLMMYEKRSWTILKGQLGKSENEKLSGEEIRTLVLTELHNMKETNPELKEELILLEKLINSGIIDLDDLENTYYAMIEEYYNDSVKYQDYLIEDPKIREKVNSIVKK